METEADLGGRGWTLIYTNFEGGARAEKTLFFGQTFPKRLFWPVFSAFYLRSTVTYDLKKRQTKFL